MDVYEHKTHFKQNSFSNSFNSDNETAFYVYPAKLKNRVNLKKFLAQCDFTVFKEGFRNVDMEKIEFKLKISFSV